MGLSSIRKKQVVGFTGVLLIGFLIAHLSGNFAIYKGPEAFNGYAAFLKSLGPLLWMMRVGLILTFVGHMFFTFLVVKENRAARKVRYKVVKDHREKATLGAKTMPYTGCIILAYLIFHLLDFTLSDHGVHEQGLYGLVVYTLSQPWHAAIYIAAMAAMGLHLSHSIQSVVQTFGISNAKIQPKLEQLSLALGVLIALAYSSIPIYILTL